VNQSDISIEMSDEEEEEGGKVKEMENLVPEKFVIDCYQEDKDLEEIERKQIIIDLEAEQENQESHYVSTILTYKGKN
jgi:hypothetical protein